MAGDVGHDDVFTDAHPVLAHRIIHVGTNGGYDHGEWYMADLTATADAARAAYPTMIHAMETRYVARAAVIDVPPSPLSPCTPGTESPVLGLTEAQASLVCVAGGCARSNARTFP